MGPACEGDPVGKFGLNDWLGVDPELGLLRSDKMSDKGLMLYEATVLAWLVLTRGTAWTLLAVPPLRVLPVVVDQGLEVPVKPVESSVAQWNF